MEDDEVSPRDEDMLCAISSLLSKWCVERELEKFSSLSCGLKSPEKIPQKREKRFDEEHHLNFFFCIIAEISLVRGRSARERERASREVVYFANGVEVCRFEGG